MEIRGRPSTDTAEVGQFDIRISRNVSIHVPGKVDSGFERSEIKGQLSGSVQTGDIYVAGLGFSRKTVLMPGWHPVVMTADMVREEKALAHPPTVVA